MIVPVRSVVLCCSAFLLLVFVILQQWEEGSLEGAIVTNKQNMRAKSKNHIKRPRAIRRNDTRASERYKQQQVVANVDKTANEGEEEDCSREVCHERTKQQHVDRWGGDLLDTTHLSRLVQQARESLETKLIVDYGKENFKHIFQHDNGMSRGRTAFLPASGEVGGVSIQRFKRKLKLKILGMQQVIETELNGVVEECTCGGNGETDASRLRRLAQDEQPPFSDYYERMVWATGGHSAAAGHGNLFNESYTSYLSQAITPVFAAIGIDFEGRNHAMGGTASAPEIALCQEAVFGRDADVITWDYAMCDAGYPQKKAMYDERIGIHPNRPAVLDINILADHPDDFSDHRKSIMKEEQRGLTTLYLDPSAFKEMKMSFPDTFGLNATQINEMPKFVRHFRCREMIEKGDPYCGDKKYDNNEICPDRSMMADWHPGWKMTALWGNTFALFLSDMLIDAIDELKTVSNRTDVLNQLRKEEDEDYRTFFESASPRDSSDYPYELLPNDSDLVNGANASVFFREPSVCHTGRLPSQTRYLGILTESQQTGVHDYFKGIPMAEARNMTSDESDEIPMPLVYDESERQQVCEVELNRDYRDCFFASSKMGWTTMTIPNEAETPVYVKESQNMLGVLVMCLVTCPWDDCPDGEMRKEAILNGQLRFEVNGSPVTNVTDLLRDCMVLRGKQGHKWQANEEGKYVFRSRVMGNGTDVLSFLRISSLILL